MKYISILLIHIITFTNCSNVQEDQSTDIVNLPQKIKLDSISEISFDIDSVTPLTSKSMWYFQDNSKNEFFTYQTNSHIFKIFDIGNQIEHSTIQIETQGTNGINKIRGGIFPIDENHFFVMHGGVPIISVIDSLARIKKRINYETNSKNSIITSAGYTFNGHQPVMIRKNKLFVSDFYFGPWGNWEKDYVLSKPFVVEIDTAKNEGQLLSYSLPDDYWKDGPLLPYFYTCLNGDKLLLSITQSNFLYIHQDNNEYKVNARSRYINKFDNYVLTYSPPESFKYQVNNGGYSSILYDKYNNLYYRFVILPYDPLENNVDWAELRNYPPKTSIIILDKNLNLIGETVLPIKKHNIFNSFVGKEGLYISNSHPDNADLKEDELTFTIYKPNYN